jgi:hypothetical protein
LLRVTLEELGPAAEAPALRPTAAWRVAQRLDADGDPTSARPYYDVASRADGLVGLKAQVRALELDPQPKVPALSAASELTAGEPELQKRVTVLLRKFVPPERRTIELAPEDPHLEIELRASHQDPEPVVAPRAPPPPRIVPVRVEGRAEGGLVVVSSSGANTLSFRKVLGVAAGIVPGADGRNRVITDLVIAWPDAEKGATVLRASLGDLGLDRLYPGVPPKEAYVRFLKDIAQASGARRLPEGTESGSLPRYAGADEMTRACHGAA